VRSVNSAELQEAKPTDRAESGSAAIPQLHAGVRNMFPQPPGIAWKTRFAKFTAVEMM